MVMRRATGRRGPGGELNNPDDDRLILQGTQEGVAGQIRPQHFMCVRHFLLSSQPLLHLILRGKRAIVTDILAGELSNEWLLPEPPELADEVHVEAAQSRAFAGMVAFPHSGARPFQTYVPGCADVPALVGSGSCQARVSLVHGTALLAPTVTTDVVCGGARALQGDGRDPIAISSLARAARLAFTLVGGRGRPTTADNFAIFRFNGWMQAGRFARKSGSATGSISFSRRAGPRRRRPSSSASRS
jgi:hypothetical protein